ncbi:MAG: hypothetical protein MN733_35135 [Nitrososphaera sp.]|nr:hypothetical protein [Nitrososphaera sp.]
MNALLLRNRPPSDGSREWFVEHRLWADRPAGKFRDETWTEWKTPMTLISALERLAELSIKGSRYYEYRVRNLRTGEIIPGEIVCL